MAEAWECGTKGSSGWDITFGSDGIYWLHKHNQVHFFNSYDSVRYFLMGYEVARDAYSKPVKESENNISSLEFVIEGVDEFEDRLKEAIPLAERLGGLLDSIRNTEFDLKIKQGE